MKSLRIALLSSENGFDPANNGGIGTYLRTVARMLAKRGHRVHAVTVHNCRDVVSTTAETLTLHVLPGPPRGDATSRARLTAEFARVIAAIKQQEGLDVVEAPDWLGYGSAAISECGI